MSPGPHPPRRRLLAGLAGLLGWFACGSRGLGQSAEDRGIGGTGAAPEVPDGDRGIGGTGVVGTIRRFGSIVVNDLRVTYPTDVTVLIDGAPARAADLRIGHVVRTVATREHGVLRTGRIEVASEVVGRVEAVRDGGLTVLGQPVSTASLLAGEVWTVGQRVAVSGLRQLDGTVAASRIESRETGPDRLAGPVSRAADGTLAIGGQRLAGLDPALAGTRVIAEGSLGPAGFQVASATDERRLIARGVRRLSVEAYVDRTPTGLRLGSGLAIAGRPAVPARAAGPVVVSSTVERNGGLRADRVRANRAGVPGGPERPGSRSGRDGTAPERPGRSPGVDRPGSPGRASGSRGPAGARDLAVDMRGPGGGSGNAPPGFSGSGHGPGRPGRPGGFGGAGPGGLGGPGGGGFGGPGGGGFGGGPGRR